MVHVGVSKTWHSWCSKTKLFQVVSHSAPPCLALNVQCRDGCELLTQLFQLVERHQELQVAEYCKTPLPRG